NIYGSNAKLIELKYLNGNSGMMMANSLVNNFCSIKFSYDDKGRISNIKYFDTNGNPINANAYLNDADLAFCKVEFIYTGTRITEQRFYQVGSETPAEIID